MNLFLDLPESLRQCTGRIQGRGLKAFSKHFQTVLFLVNALPRNGCVPKVFLLLTDGISHAEEHFAGRHEGGGAVGEHADLKKSPNRHILFLNMLFFNLCITSIPNTAEKEAASLTP